MNYDCALRDFFAESGYLQGIGPDLGQVPFDQDFFCGSEVKGVRRESTHVVVFKGGTKHVTRVDHPYIGSDTCNLQADQICVCAIPKVESALKRPKGEKGNSQPGPARVRQNTLGL